MTLKTWAIVAAFATLASAPAALAAGNDVVIGDIDDLSGNYADVAGAGGGHGSLRTRENNSRHRDGKALRELRKRERGSRIASDHDRLGVLFEQHRRNLETVTLDSSRAFSAVGHARCIAKIENGLVRQQSPQRAYHGQTADAGIENTDRLRLVGGAALRVHVTHRR